jgi:hypothetical protein
MAVTFSWTSPAEPLGPVVAVADCRLPLRARDLTAGLAGWAAPPGGAVSRAAAPAQRRPSGVFMGARMSGGGFVARSCGSVVGGIPRGPKRGFAFAGDGSGGIGGALWPPAPAGPAPPAGEGGRGPRLVWPSSKSLQGGGCPLVVDDSVDEGTGGGVTEKVVIPQDPSASRASACLSGRPRRAPRRLAVIQWHHSAIRPPCRGRGYRPPGWIPHSGVGWMIARAPRGRARRSPDSVGAQLEPPPVGPVGTPITSAASSPDLWASARGGSSDEADLLRASM